MSYDGKKNCIEVIIVMKFRKFQTKSVLYSIWTIICLRNRRTEKTAFCNDISLGRFSLFDTMATFFSILKMYHPSTRRIAHVV